MTMTITIFGAGAIGGTTGAALARAGHDVLLVDNTRRTSRPSRAVLFFCGDDSGCVTGQTISVDGGMWMLG